MFVFVELAVNFIEPLIIIYFFNKVTISRNNLLSMLLDILFVIMFFLLSTLGLDSKFLISANTLIELLVIIYVIISKLNPFYEKLFLFIFYWSIFKSVSLLSVAFSAYIYSIPVNDLAFDLSIERIVMILMVKLIQFILAYILSNKFKFKNYATKKILILLGIICLSSSMICQFIFTIFLDFKVDIYTLVLLFLLFIIPIITVSILSDICNKIENNLTLQMSIKNNKLTEKYYENYISIYNDMKGWKHDFRNHISVLSILAKENLSEDFINYIDDIDTNTSYFENLVYTKNLAIDSILENKIKVSKDNNIDFKLSADLNDPINISNVDICILLGNLLDNSIEACQNLSNNKFIELALVLEKEKLFIKISNSADNNLRIVDGKYHTTKEVGLHGLGLNQIDKIVDKYNGYIFRNHKDSIFITSLMLENKPSC